MESSAKIERVEVPEGELFAFGWEDVVLKTEFDHDAKRYYLMVLRRG